MKFIFKLLFISFLILTSLNAFSSTIINKEINFSIIEKDNCNRIDLLKEQPIIIITAICSPKENKYFFNLWKSTEKIFVSSRIHSKKINTDNFPISFKFKDFLSSKQFVLRKKTSKRKFPKIIIYDQDLFLKITKFYEQNKNFDILLATSKTYNLLTFDFNKNTNEPLSYDVNQISSFKEIQKQNFANSSYFHTFNLDIIDDSAWYCKLKKPAIDTYKFLDAWGNDGSNNNFKNCWYEFIVKKKTLKHVNKIEEFTWYLIRQVNLDYDKINTNRHKIFNSLKTVEKKTLRNFISYKLIQFATNKKFSTQSIYKILNIYFQNNIVDLYMASLAMNCSSFSKKIITNAQERIEYYSKKMSLDERAYARFHFYLNRKENFPNIGYAAGPYGIIGKFNNYDYCVNLGTNIDYFWSQNSKYNEKTIKDKSIQSINYLHIIEINKELAKEDISLEQKTILLDLFWKKLQFFQKDKKSFIPFKLWYFHSASLNYFSSKNFTKALENWKKYIEFKYEKINYKKIERSDAKFTIEILSKRNIDKKIDDVEFFRSFIKSYSRDLIFGNYLNSKNPINYYDDFNLVETDLKILDQIQIVLKDLYKFEDVDDFIFKVLQKKNITAESLAFTRYFTIPDNYIVSNKIKLLLSDRKEVIKTFYNQMIFFNSNSVNERDKLTYFNKIIENDKKNFFPSKNSTLEELFTSGTLVLPANIKRNQIGITSQIYISNLMKNVDFFRQNKPSYYGLDDIKFNNFNSNLAINSYKKLKELDKTIELLDKDAFEIITNKALSIKDVRKGIKNNEAIIFISQNSISHNYTTYTITNKKYKISIHKNSLILKKCLKEFETNIINQNYQENKCNELYRDIFFSNEKILGSEVTNLKYIVQGEIKKIPPSLIYKNIGTQKNTSNTINQNKNYENKRGISLDNLNKNSNERLLLDWYWKEYNFILYPSFGLLKVADFYQKYKTKNNDFYLGVAVSKLPSSNKNSFNIFSKLSLQDIPQTKIEVENNSKIWGLNKSKILLNEDANIINLRSYFKDVHPKILSIGTHTIKRIQKNKSKETSLLLYPNSIEALDESFLTPKKIEKNKLSADLVILSSCKTMETENNFSQKSNLASSFLINGSKSILVTYWQIEDLSTRIFMNTFFKTISNQKTKYSDALKISIQKLIDKGYKHPFYWAPFAIMGHAN